MKPSVDYLAEAKAAAAVDNQLAQTYALISIADAIQANSVANLAAAAEAGARAAIEAFATLYNITMTGRN